MANVMDYLDWRGDLSFAASPFNEVDNYICAVIGGPDYAGIVPEDAATVELGEVAARYTELHAAEGDRIGAICSPYIVPMLRRLPQTARYREMRLGGYISIFDAERAEQFSAVTALLPDGSAYIAFRGTDDTILGWKEDFLMGVTDEVPAQTDALRYLQWAAETFPGPLRVGGHSKGGNLAVYAAIHADEALQDRIIAVYNNDGPGFRTSVVGTPGYERIRGRLQAFLPQNSMVGMLLERVADPVIIRSNRFGMEAHDGFTWEVLGTAFVRCPDFSMATRAFGDAMAQVEKDMSSEERAVFVDALFDVLTSTNAVTLTDLTEHGLRQAASIVLESRRAPEVKKFLTDILELMFREYAEEVRGALPEPRWAIWKRAEN